MKTKTTKFLLILILISFCIASCNPKKDSADMSQNNNNDYQKYVGELLTTNANQDYYNLFKKDFKYSSFTLLDKSEILNLLKGKKFNNDAFIREFDKRTVMYGVLFKDANTPDLGDQSKDNYEVLYFKRGNRGPINFGGGAFLVIDDFGYPCPDLIQCERCVGCGGPYPTCFMVCMSESGDNCNSCN